MKKLTMKSLLVILPVILVISCKPAIKVSSDYDRAANFSAYKSFSLAYLLTSRNVNELNEERIWNSIRTEMIKKGYTETNHKPDLVVNAVSVLNNKKYVSANTNFYGYVGTYRPYGYWGGTGMASGQTTFQAHNYKEGSLVIEIVNARTNKLVWEGIGNAEFENRPKNPDQVINSAVNKILAGFPQNDARK